MIPEISQEKGMIAGDATAHGKAERKGGFVALSREMLQTLSMLFNLCESHCAALCDTGEKIPTTGCLQGPLSRCPILIGTFVATHDRGLTPISVERWENRLLFSGCLLVHRKSCSVAGVGDTGGGSGNGKAKAAGWTRGSEPQSRSGDGLG